MKTLTEEIGYRYETQMIAGNGDHFIYLMSDTCLWVCKVQKAYSL